MFYKIISILHIDLFFIQVIIIIIIYKFHIDSIIYLKYLFIINKEYFTHYIYYCIINLIYNILL